ncbi:MAG: DUF484 family protein [Steroidobacteraceae bacterium]
MTTAADVARFLESHPDFFDQHPELLEHLHVPHVAGSATISLVERQVKLLRDKQAASRERLAELVRVARHNDQLAARIHLLTLRLLQTRNIDEIAAQVESVLRDEFHVTPARLIRRGTTDGEALLKESTTLFSNGKPRCGHFGSAVRSQFFGEAGDGLASIALVPLGTGATVGVLALGSADADRFHPGVATEFLERVGEMITAALVRLSATSTG